MDRDYGMEIDRLQKEMSEVKSLLQQLVRGNENARDAAEKGKETGIDMGLGKTEEMADKLEMSDMEGMEGMEGIEGIEGIEGMDGTDAMETAYAFDGEFVGEIQVISGMHPDPQLSAQMEKLCRLAGEGGKCGLVDYMGVFSSGGRQSSWIKHHVDVGELLALIENHMAEKVLHCIGNSDRLNILLAILQKPRTVAELVTVCGLNSTGQAYHHMKPLLAADLIVEDDASGGAVKGVYIVRPHKVQGIIMLLAGIADMVDETYTKGSWDNLDV